MSITAPVPDEHPRWAPGWSLCVRLRPYHRISAARAVSEHRTAGGRYEPPSRAVGDSGLQTAAPRQRLKRSTDLGLRSVGYLIVSTISPARKETMDYGADRKPDDEPNPCRE